MAIRTPPLYATGKWVLQAPFTVDSNTVYVCKAIRSFDDIKAQGIDPYVTYYQPLGLTVDDFKADVANLANIVTLMSETAPVVYVPDSYIVSYPDTTMIPYRHVVLSVSLGAVPDTLVLDDFLDKVEQTAMASLGLEVNVRAHQAGVLTEGVDQRTHQSLERVRLLRINTNETELAKHRRTLEELERLREQNRLLEAVIVERGLLD